ncbi:ThiF family adenylyltransferase [Paraflavitalea speifideaquila]|uniref:ThiF family adenylyltransferase n=1 Tax=Paraflavitalea speifideaquila TaxID=3076558 RepID=UPI0028F04A07|nr:ThiF family adenylyltransferase [Paraflavitalea speifideiaquila]
MAEKIALDLNGLKHWITKYYINQEIDANYEHIIVNHNAIDGENRIFIFTDVDYTFKQGMYGQFNYSLLNEGTWRKEIYSTLMVQNFKINRDQVACKWSEIYRQLDTSEGIFYFNNVPPVKNKRFTVESFHELENFFSQEFLRYMDAYSKKIQFSGSNISHIPLLIGYPINKTEIHWQAILIPINDFPNYGQKIVGTNAWISRLKEQSVIWAQTRNSSYSYFFGRGAFHPKIAKAKVLILGIGAIGSMISTTLVRGGVTDIVLVDHDIKEPENICRSEYSFLPGLTSKVNELTNRLTAISPFVEIKTSEALTDLFKIAVNDDNADWLKAIKEHLDQYDLIFDCSTDNDIAFLIGKLNLNCEVFSLSITNHARELICATKQNIYIWMQQIFHQLEQESEDLYISTGCWSPTFKASFNDISVLVQFALRHINQCFIQTTTVRNFFLSCSEENEFTIKLRQF